MNYGKINTTDIANGVGVRVSLFVSGCPIKCKGCFNAEAQDPKYGERFSIKTFREIVDAMDPHYIAGLTVLGGEPLAEYNRIEVRNILEVIKEIYPNKTIWVYTGYRYEQFKDHPIMRFIDVLVDGPFIEAEKDITLKFRGSRNQRIIDVQASRAANKVVTLDY